MGRYFDRVEAGRRLAEIVAPRLDGPAVVLAVPRGGVQVGAQVAKALHAPLLPLLVRKVGLPEQPSVVVGAIDADGAMVMDELAPDLGLLPAEMEAIGEDVSRRLLRWRESFGSPDPATAIRGRVAVLVDDAIVSGLTTAAGVQFLERRGAQRIVVAVPSAVAAGRRRLERRGVEVIAPVQVDLPEQIQGTYEHLPEVSAREVAILLAQAGPSTPRNLRFRGGVDEPLRLVDSRLEAHRARLHVPRGLGPAPAMILVGLSRGREALVMRLAEAGIASLRIDFEPTQADGSTERVADALRAALGILASRPELDPYRLGILGAGALAPVAIEVGTTDARARLLVLVEPPRGTSVPEGSFVFPAAELEARSTDRLVRWLGDSLYPTESA